MLHDEALVFLDLCLFLTFHYQHSTFFNGKLLYSHNTPIQIYGYETRSYA